MSGDSVRASMLAQACRDATGIAPGSQLEQIDPELVALLASGDLRALSEPEQIAVWSAAAADPAVAAWIADLVRSGAVVSSEAASPRGASRAGLRLALAACGALAFGMLAWRLADPPGTASAPAPIEFMDGGGSPEHPVDAAAAARGWSGLDIARDAVLLALLAATAVLAWPALRDFDRPANRA